MKQTKQVIQSLKHLIAQHLNQLKDGTPMVFKPHEEVDIEAVREAFQEWHIKIVKGNIIVSK